MFPANCTQAVDTFYLEQINPNTKFVKPEQTTKKFPQARPIMIFYCHYTHKIHTRKTLWYRKKTGTSKQVKGALKSNGHGNIPPLFTAIINKTNKAYNKLMDMLVYSSPFFPQLQVVSPSPSDRITCFITVLQPLRTSLYTCC